jgi:hypothetical protein
MSRPIFRSEELVRQLPITACRRHLYIPVPPVMLRSESLCTVTILILHSIHSVSLISACTVLCSSVYHVRSRKSDAIIPSAMLRLRSRPRCTVCFGYISIRVPDFEFTENESLCPGPGRVTADMPTCFAYTPTVVCAIRCRPFGKGHPNRRPHAGEGKGLARPKFGGIPKAPGPEQQQSAVTQHA